MANREKQVPENVPGSFFVDTTCINCDTCRQLAPDIYGETDDEEFSYVKRQPEDADAGRLAFRALLACPTGSIGVDEVKFGLSAAEVKQDFPLPLAEDVYYCGFNSEKSYGGNSYFIRHPEGNWLVDSPRYLPFLARRFKEMGGVRYIFLTHRDDVADADRYAGHFDSTRLIHQAELSAQPGAEYVFSGDDPVRFSDDFLIVPTPGHTRGHSVLLYKNRFLFTGDHLWGSEGETLGVSRTYNWYSWERQKESLEKLLDYPFEAVLPGHGRRLFLPEKEMRARLTGLLQVIG